MAESVPDQKAAWVRVVAESPRLEQQAAKLVGYRLGDADLQLDAAKLLGYRLGDADLRMQQSCSGTASAMRTYGWMPDERIHLPLASRLLISFDPR